MRYIDALNLINLSIKNNILHEKEGNVFVYRNSTPNSKEGWYLTDKDMLAKELMHDKEGQKILVGALKNIDIDFV